MTKERVPSACTTHTWPHRVTRQPCKAAEAVEEVMLPSVGVCVKEISCLLATRGTALKLAFAAMARAP